MPEEVTLSNNGQELFLKISDLEPSHQVKLTLDLKAADGVEFKELVYMTINKVPQ